MYKFLLLLLLTIYPLSALEQYGINLERYTYPFEVKRFNVTIQQQTLSIAYMDVEPEAAKANGKSVLLFHGKNFTGAYWKQTADKLLEKGYRVIMPDQIGFGKSSKPDHIQYTFEMLARTNAKLMDELQISHSYLLAHSMGGMLAARYALMFPQRVDKLILENPVGLEDWQRFVSNPSFDFWYKRELSKTAESVYKYQLESYYDGKWKAKYQPWVDLFASYTLSAEYPKFAWNQALISQMMFSQPVIYQFDQLRMPVLLIIGQRDKTALAKGLATAEVRKKMGNYAQLGKDAQKRIPNATLLELPGIGHMPHVENFDDFIKGVIDFLAESK